MEDMDRADRSYGGRGVTVLSPRVAFKQYQLLPPLS